MPSYFNIFECDRNIFNTLDVTYERACMATQIEEYYTNLLENIIDHNDRHNAPLSNEKLQELVSAIIAKT